MQVPENFWEMYSDVEDESRRAYLGICHASHDLNLTHFAAFFCFLTERNARQKRKKQQEVSDLNRDYSHASFADRDYLGFGQG